MLSRPDPEREGTGPTSSPDGGPPSAPGAPHRFDPPLRPLSPFVEGALRGACEALMADEDDEGALVLPSEAAVERSLAWVRAALSATTSGLSPAFALLVVLLELLPPFFIGRFSRMSRLPLAERIEYLETLEQHRFGLFSLLFTAIKVPVTIPAFEAGEELRDTGFDRPSLSSRRRLPVAKEAA